MVKFEQEVNEYIQTHALIQSGDRILVACSGGIDSIVLLHFLHTYQKHYAIDLAAVHVNHMLRGEASYEDRQFVEDFCKEREIPVFSTDIPISEILKRENGNLQDTCRRERYHYFEQVMKQHHYNKLAVAHHADDQMETVLMALIKGAHIQGVLGMSAEKSWRSFKIIRPFLSVTREQLVAYLNSQSLMYREDASNAKDDYLRNRIRHHVVPFMKKENPQVAAAFQYFTEKEQAEDVYLNEQAESVLKQCEIQKNDDEIYLRILPFQKQSLALQRRAILLLLKYLYKDTIVAQSHALWTAILELIQKTDGHNEISLPLGGRAIRTYDVLVLTKRPQVQQVVQPLQLQLGEWVTLINGCKIGVFQKSSAPQVSKYVKSYILSTHQLPLTIRTKEVGDRMYLPGVNGSKKVSRILIDAKIPQSKRSTWPILVDAKNQILAILDLRVSRLLQDDMRSIDDGVVLMIDTAPKQ